MVSILGRFLEHSRIYSFERGKERSIYVGSADLMPRNLYNRVELLVPVEDKKIRSQLSDVLDACLTEHVGAWELQPSGEWVRRPSTVEDVHVQVQLIELHRERATEIAVPPAFPDCCRHTIAGFIEVLGSRAAGQPMRVTSSRPSGSRIALEVRVR